MQDDGADVVQGPNEAEAVEARPRARDRKLTPAILMSREGSETLTQQAQGLVWLAPAVFVPEEAASPLQLKMRPSEHDIGYQPCFFLEYEVVEVWAFEHAPTVSWYCSCDGAIAGFQASDAEMLRSVEGNVSFFSCVVTTAKSVLEGGWSTLLVLPGRSRKHCCDLAQARGFPVPPRSLFRKASRRRAAMGLAFRARKRRRAEGTPDQVKQIILWSRASQHMKDTSQMKTAAGHVLDAILNDFADSECMEDLDRVPDRRQLLACRIRIDALSCLLQRRELHDFRASSIVRGLKADASPKLHAEVMAMHVESISFDPVKIGTDNLPGATLAHGLSKLAQKAYIFLWGLHLCYGPTIRQLKQVLRSIRFVLTDFGTESGIADLIDIIKPWAHWAHGASHRDCTSSQ